MDIKDILNSFDGASLVMKAEGSGTTKVEAKGPEYALITMAAACLASLCSQMGDAATTEKRIHKIAKKVIESGILEKEAED